MISSVFRFHGHGSLRYVYANGKAIRSQFITIKSIRNDRRQKPRFSVVVSKKVYKSAVGRNRIRRRIYEYIRNNIDNLDAVYDVVVIVTSSEVKDLPYSELSEMLDQIFEKAELYKSVKN